VSDPELILQAMLLVAALCVVTAAGLVIATVYYFLEARRLWRQARRGPEVVRDHNGRRFKERI
jgi:hypothetical protein